MAMSGNPIARRLYLRIWLAVAGSVLVLSVLVGGAWHMAEQEREHDRQAGQPREELVRDAAGELIGTAEAQPRRLPGQGLEFVVTLRDGQVLSLQLPPRKGRPAALAASPFPQSAALPEKGEGAKRHRGLLINCGFCNPCAAGARRVHSRPARPCRRWPG